MLLDNHYVFWIWIFFQIQPWIYRWSFRLTFFTILQSKFSVNIIRCFFLQNIGPFHINPQIILFRFYDSDSNVTFLDICFVRHLLCKDANILGWAPGELLRREREVCRSQGVKVMTSKRTETADLSSGHSQTKPRSMHGTN